MLLNIHIFSLFFFNGLINDPAASRFDVKSVDYYTEIAEVMGLNPGQAHIVFRLSFEF